MKKQNILLLSLLTTIGLFIYLTIHHYSVKLGIGGNTLCSINSKINCDAAALSSFSEVAGIPIAIMGAIFHFVLFGFIVLFNLNWIERSPYLQRTLRFMLGSSAFVSLVMAVISAIIVKVACPFCLGTYVLSFLNLYLGWNLIKEDDSDFNYLQYLSQYKSHLILLAIIPFVSWIIAGMIQENYGLAEIKKIVPEKIEQWKNGQHYDFDLQNGLSTPSDQNSKAVLVEFADFKCPHCKVASQTIDTFLKGHPEVHFVFKPFPLDGSCNASDKMQRGDGTRCTLAGWALCAEKLSRKGWDLHHWIFSKQEEIMNVNDLRSFLPEIEKEFKIDTKALSDCADSSETYDLLKKSSEEGNKAEVSGTPTIYLNGKKLPYGQIMDVLRAAVETTN